MLTQTNLAFAATLSELTIPTKQIPFKQVIPATTHRHVLDFDPNDPAHAELRNKILAAAKLAGNHTESFVKVALREVGLHAQTPTNSLGKAQTTGYPDAEIASELPSYIELKTYNAATADTTQRTFYYSPSEHPKVTHDALHLLLAFQLEKTERDGKTVFVPARWKLISLQGLRVYLKFEFNQSNRGLYGRDSSEALLGEDTLK